MELTPEEQRELAKLQAKLAAASITTTDGAGRTIPLSQYIASEPAVLPPNVAYLRGFLEKVEAGIITDFVAIGLAPNQADLSVAFATDPSRAKPTLAMIGALDVVRAMLVRPILPK